MTDVDERLRAAGEAFRQQPVPDLSLHWPQERRVQRWLAPLAVAAAVALVVGGVFGVASLHHDPAQPPAQPPARRPAKPSTAPVLLPDRDFAVGYPYNGASGPSAGQPPAVCAPGAMHATATTRASSEGVVGLLTITAARGCSLPVEPSSIALVGADQRSLRVATSKGNVTNPVSVRSEFAENAGQVRLGFAWSGSYCGPAAKNLAVTVAGNDALLVALNGPSPGCRTGVNDSVLVPGVVGSLTDAVEPPPLSWKSLTAKVILPPTVVQGHRIPLTVVITNNSASPVSLASPCPKYITLTSLDVHGDVSQYGGGGDLCSSPLTVQPGKPVTLTLPTLEFPAFSDLPRTVVSSGDPLTVTWSIAGVPSVIATTHIR